MNAYFRHLDYLMLATVLSITAFGLWILKNATRTDPGNLYGHQVVYVGVGIVGMMVVAAVPPRLMRRMLLPLYGFVLATTAIVLAIGTTVQGGTRWINLGAFQFQPSEFSKLLLIVGLAALLANRRGVTPPGRLSLMALAFVAIPAGLVFMEPDFGTTLVLVVLLFGMLFVYGMPWQHFVWFGMAVAVAGALVFSILPAAGVHVVKQYQYDRLTSFLHPNQNDPQGNGYHLIQSKIAIAHGGLAGTGPAGATQTQLGYLPEHATDFIFSVVGEERGFLGSAWLIGLYALFLWRGLKLITRSRSIFGSLVAAGVVSVITFQVFINIGMTIGLAPITGIPLPFMSFGGTHTITNLLAVGVLQSVHVHAAAADERAQAFALRRLRPDDGKALGRAAVVVYAGEILEALDSDTRADLAVVGASDRPIVAVLEGLDQPGDALIEAARTPGLPPSAVVAAKQGRFPDRQLLQAVAERAGSAGPSLAARLPALRPAVVEQVIAAAARRNGATATLVPVPGQDMAALTSVELRMVLQIAACHGQELSADRLLEVAGVLGAGLGMRALARELLDVVPVAGWMVKGAVAYSGTRGLGRAADEYFQRGAPADVGKLRSRAGGLR